MKLFILTPTHITLLQKMHVRWDDVEFGAPAIDSKRPYGNSDVTQDIAKILGIVPEGADGYLSSNQEDKLTKLHLETQTALQIVLCQKSFEPGTFKKTSEYERTSWVRV